MGPEHGTLSPLSFPEVESLRQQNQNPALAIVEPMCFFLTADLAESNRPQRLALTLLALRHHRRLHHTLGKVQSCPRECPGRMVLPNPQGHVQNSRRSSIVETCRPYLSVVVSAYCSTECESVSFVFCCLLLAREVVLLVNIDLCDL